MYKKNVKNSKEGEKKEGKIQENVQREKLNQKNTQTDLLTWNMVD